ncbi:FAS1 domain-containing protein [Artemisia annua]|uniref:FAS1 domain-containing protein n=1 Tax=Artemisia annua TaxID=35608 RepID=A0A2U1KHX2_ARTAN|nr:FAS1 domain-containing protein [Artemisia annua]
MKMYPLQIYATLLILSLFLARPICGAPSQISSNSVLVALIDSAHYTELTELVEKALLLQTLEGKVAKSNITVFAPSNEALEMGLDPDFKRFLLEPRNLKSLQSLVMFHVVPGRVGSENWPGESGSGHDPGEYRTLCDEEGEGEDDKLVLTRESSGQKYVGGLAKVTRPDDVVRFDGVVHGIDRLLVPRVVVEEFNKRRSLREISAVLPEGAPVVDPRTNRLKKNAVSPVPAGAPPVLPVAVKYPNNIGLTTYFLSAKLLEANVEVKDFIQTLLHYGGYNELADILVNLTSLATEMGKLVSEGYVLTVLAPNDEAMAKLTTDQLSDPGAPEQIIYYHLIPEYQTEESMYNSVRRFGKVQYDTLRVPHKVVAEEADGSVKFGSGEESAYLFDPDIYTDGRISVQGIDGVLFPMEEKAEKNATEVDTRPQVKVVAKQNRGVFVTFDPYR